MQNKNHKQTKNKRTETNAYINTINKYTNDKIPEIELWNTNQESFN